MEKNDSKKQTVKGIAWAMGLYTSSSIIGPLVVFGVPGHLLDRYFGTGPAILLVSVILAFVATNFLLYRKVKILTRSFDEVKEKTEEENKK